MRRTTGRIRPQLLACALCFMALTLPTTADARFPSSPWGDQRCARLSGDSVCRWRGLVQVADRVGAALAPEQLLPLRQARRLGGEGTRVTTGPNAVARLLFRGRARCRLGGSGQPGDYFAHPGEETLFNQYLGYASCTSFNGSAPKEASVLCSPEEPCPATLRWNGTFFTKSRPPEATSSLVDSYVRRVRIVVCSGFVRVRAEDEHGFAEGGGHADRDSRWVIVVEEKRTTTYEEGPTGTVTDTSKSVRISLSQREQGRGGCASSSIEEQEHTVAP